VTAGAKRDRKSAFKNMECNDDYYRGFAPGKNDAYGWNIVILSQTIIYPAFLRVTTRLHRKPDKKYKMLGLPANDALG